MDSDWSVELGNDDPLLVLPWAADDGSSAYVDLKRFPKLIVEISEVRDYPELADFLRTLNARNSPLLTAKCDAWSQDDLSEAEQIYEARIKFCSYVDMLFTDERDRCSFERNESFVKAAASALAHEAEQNENVAAELIVRRCWFCDQPKVAENEESRRSDPRQGFYITFYLFGYGADEAEARSRWRAGLQYVTAVLPAVGLDLR